MMRYEIEEARENFETVCQLFSRAYVKEDCTDEEYHMLWKALHRLEYKLSFHHRAELVRAFDAEEVTK